MCGGYLCSMNVWGILVLNECVGDNPRALSSSSQCVRSCVCVCVCFHEYTWDNLRTPSSSHSVCVYIHIYIHTYTHQVLVPKGCKLILRGMHLLSNIQLSAVLSHILRCLLPIAYQSETHKEATGVYVHVWMCVCVREKCLLPIAYQS
jgi:hypothetical protein